MNPIKRFYPLLIALLVLPSIGLAQSFASREKSPQWVDYSQRERMFPQSQYVVGFASDRYERGSDLKELENQLETDARTSLVESIQVSIRSMAVSQISTVNQQSESAFRRTSVSLSKVELQGLKTETFFDEKTSEAYAFSYADKSKISELYRNKIVSKKAIVEQNLQNAEKYIAEGDNQNALKSYYANMPVFREIEEAQTLIMTFEGVTPNAEHLHFKAINELKIKNAKGIKTLQSAKSLSIDDAAYLIAMGLKFQADSIQDEIRLANFTYQDTKMASTFSKRFTNSLESKMSANSFQVTIHQKSMLDNLEESHYCEMIGTYWEEGENIKLIANIRDSRSGKTLASSEANISKEWLTQNSIDYKPENYNNAIKNLVQFNNETKPTGGLIVDISTNKGSDGLIFSENEEMKIYVRTNRACYIRLIYHLADGHQVLLFDSYYISNDKANQVIEIPETFVCSEPFGVETLQLNAQTEAFTPLRTRSEYGYDFIDEDLKNVLFKTRGFKPKKNKDAKTEKRIIITTMKN